MNLQNEFESFHETIKLGTYTDNQDLRDKRDLLIKELRKKLKDELVPGTDKKLTFAKIDQGSYAMNTGIKPKNDEFDIDVGIIFDINNNEYDPGKLKKLIHDKLNEQHNRTVEYNRPCITVKYNEGYHVDLAIYSNNDDDLHISWGKKHSQEKIWYESDPKGLTQWVADVSQDSDKSRQYRRCVRFLKKWKEKHFTSSGNGAPPSVGLTVQARSYFIYHEDSYLDTLIHIVKNMISDFGITYDDNFNQKHSISVCLPVQPYKNIYYKMSLNHQDIFYDKLEILLESLEAARNEKSIEKACKILIKVFGDEFPLSEDDDATDEAKTAPVILTGQNA